MICSFDNMDNRGQKKEARGRERHRHALCNWTQVALSSSYQSCCCTIGGSVMLFVSISVQNA